MIQKHRIHTDIGRDQKINIELKQDFDLLEILSLKFTQKDVYATGLCSDYGVVVGRVSVNNGFGVPNARISIFIPLSDVDENDPVVAALYPYKEINDTSEDGYRYHLLPSRKQHTGHTPTGKFFDQEDILSREEYMEVFEKYYKYTVKTNDAGDFMIWGVPLGQQIIHCDVDLSDIGCQSLIPYDLMYEGVSPEKFINGYTYRDSNNLSDLPQIVSFDRTIEVYPFWGNEELCEIGITRTDFDLKEKGIRIEPYALLMGGTFTDTGKDALTQNCNVDNQMGEKCRLTTHKGDIEAIRFSGNYEKDINGNPIIDRPILESVKIDSVIDDNGTFFFRVPMNMTYLTTDEFGNLVESKNPNVGIPTQGNYRFRFSLGEDAGARNVFTGKFLVPNIREYHTNDTSRVGEYGTINPKSYSFSTSIDDYPSEALGEMTGTSVEAISEGKTKVPQDYFFQLRYNRVYSVSQFVNKYYKASALEKLFSFLVKDRNESFIGIKEIWPEQGADCSGTNNFFPINDAVRNHRFNFFILTIISYIEYIGLLIQLFFKEITAQSLFAIAELLESTGVSSRASAKMFQRAKEFQFRNIFKLSLITYPDCYDCNEDTQANEITVNVPKLEFDAVTGTTATFSNVTMKERYQIAREDGTCSKYTFTNSSPTSGYTVTYLDCDNNSTTATVPANGTLDNVCGKPGQSLSSGTITSVETVNGCSGVSGFDPDGSLYFDTFTPVTPLPTNNSGVNADGDFLYQRYVFEIELFSGQSDYITVGVGQQFPIVWDNEYSQWKIQLIYSSIISQISEAFNTPLDHPVSGTCHEIDGRVKIKNVWFDPAGNVPYSSVTINEVESGCQKYDAIIEDELGRTGDMRLRGIVLPLTGSTGGTVDTYVEGLDRLKLYRAPNAALGTNPIYNQLDYDYNDTILGLNIGECETRPPYNLGGVASEFAKWPTENRGDFRNEDSRCIYRGTYYGQVKKKGPYYVEVEQTNGGTLTGWSEFRDGVYTIIPLAGKNGELLSSYRRRKLFGKLMCGGVVSYIFTDSWINGVLYFFQFKRRGENNFCKDCVYKKVDTDGSIHYYYRSTPYHQEYSNFETQYNGTDIVPNTTKTYDEVYSGKTQGFYGTRRIMSFDPSVSGKAWVSKLTDLIGGSTYKREINFPTTIVDLGPRLTWINEVCIDAALDVNCSVSRSIGATSFKGVDDLMEYIIQSKEIKEKGRLDVQDLFDRRGKGQIDGDIAQLLNFNTQTGIYPFESEQSNSPYTSLYANLFDGKGAVGLDFVFSEDDTTTPTIEYDGSLIRKCINTPGRLGDNSQRVPYYMWDTHGHGFGEVQGDGEVQSYYTGRIYNQRIQEFTANLNPDPNSLTIDDNFFNPNILPPIRDCIEVNGVKSKSNDNYKEYTVNGQIRHLMEIGVPFHYTFGLRKGKTAFDKFIEMFGPN
jgi:hypothetical protein